MDSNMRLFSIGIVVDDKAPGSKFISAYPLEHLPHHEGELTSEHELIERSGTDADGNSYNISLQRGTSVKAEWYNANNRITAPNVKKGEQVELWTVGVTNKYYWKSMGRDDHLRRGETVTWAFNASDSKSNKNVVPDATNQYSVTVDTVDQHMTLVTSCDNGEKAAYTLQVNGKTGHVSVADNLGNVFQFDSANSRITFHNRENTSVVLDKKVITVNAPDKLTIKAPTIIIESKNITISGHVEFKGKVDFKDDVNGPKATFTTLDCTTLHNVAIDRYKKT